MDRAGRQRNSGARGGQRMVREEPGTVADVFLAAFPALVTELGIGFVEGPPIELGPVAVLDTPALEAKRSFLVVELAVHDWCPIALRRTGTSQPAEWLDQLPEVLSAADARHASGTLMQARTVTSGNYEGMTLDYAREAADAAGAIDLDLPAPDNRPHFVNAGKAGGRCLAAWAAATGQHEDAFKLAAAALERLESVTD